MVNKTYIHKTVSVIGTILTLLLLSVGVYGATATIDQNGNYTVANSTISANGIVSDVINVTNYMGMVVGSYFDGYSCSDNYCVYHPWYSSSNTYVKNGTTQKIMFSGTNANTVLSSFLSTLHTGDVVSFNSGVFNTSGTHLVLSQSYVTLKGSQYGTEIFNSGDTALEITGTNENIADINFYSGTGNAGTAALLLTNSHRNSITNVRIDGGYYGIWLKGSLINNFYNIIGSTNIGSPLPSVPTAAWIYTSTYNAINANANTFYGITLEGGNEGVNFQGTSPYPSEGGNSVYGCTIEGITGIGLNITGSSQPVLISGCHLESNTLDISITNAWGVTVQNSIFKKAINSGKGIKFENDVVTGSIENSADSVLIDGPTRTFFSPSSVLFNGSYNGRNQFYTADSLDDIYTVNNLTLSQSGIVQSTDTTLFHFNGGSRTVVFRIPNNGATSIWFSHVARNSADGTLRQQDVSYSSDGSSFTLLYSTIFSSGDIVNSGTFLTSGKYSYIKITQNASYALKWIGVSSISITPNLEGVLAPFDLTSTDFGNRNNDPTAFLQSDFYWNTDKLTRCTWNGSTWNYNNDTSGC